MKSQTANALTNGYQVSYAIPSDFAPPLFTLGQMVETIDKQGHGDIKGHVVGMVYTSRDAALARGSLPGWYYIVETPAFQCSNPHHQFNEDNLQPLIDRQEVA
jgi:hypothetical protein